MYSLETNIRVREKELKIPKDATSNVLYHSWIFLDYNNHKHIIILYFMFMISMLTYIIYAFKLFFIIL